MFNPKAYENSRPDGIGVLEIVNGNGAAHEEPRRFVPLKRTELRGDVVGPLGSLRLVQTFGVAHEQCDNVLEALYRFPLPGDAAVMSVRVRFGDVDIQTELKERRQAEQDYDDAKQQGRQAALVTRESPDVFTLRVAGIQPDQDVTVETGYVQLARAEGAGWSLRIPLTTAPRYVRSDELTSRHAQGQPLCLLRDPGHRFGLDVCVQAASEVRSTTHRLEVTREKDSLHVRLHDGEVIPDRDCVLSWRPTQEQQRAAFDVRLHDDPTTGEVYFLALVSPPATHDRGCGIPREVVLLVDHSGSMEGAKWQAADWTVERFLSELTERDTFAMGLFHNTTRWFSPQLCSANTETVQEAVAFLQMHRDSGGTELGVALEQALELNRVGGESARHVLIVTDAEVSDAGRILRLADAEANRSDRRRVSVLCIDAAPNSLLATELAERGGGVARFLTSDPAQEDIATALDDVLADWAEPVLMGLRLEINRPRVEAAGRAVSDTRESGSMSIDLGDLPAGRAVWVAGRVPRADGGPLVFRLTTVQHHEVAACRIELPNEAAPTRETHHTFWCPSLKALFGARRLRGLEYLMHSGYDDANLRKQLQRLGYDPQEDLANPAAKPTKVYAENIRADASAALRELLVRESLSYGLASSETAFIAARSETGKPVQQTLVVANALPSGWSEDRMDACMSFASPGYSGPVGTLSAGMSRSARSSGGFGVMRSLVRRVGHLFDADTLSADDLEDVDDTTAHHAKPVVLFSGIPEYAAGEAIVFDSTRDQNSDKLPDRVTFDCLLVGFPKGTPKADDLDPELCLLIFVDDLASPRARVRLRDIIRQRGERPLNLLKLPGQVVRLVLSDPTGAWTNGAPQLEISIRWS